MSLRDITLKTEYRSLLDNVARDFYIPLLSEAISYKRAVGFFSSSVLIEISKGITKLVQNGGKIQLIVSPYLSEEDINAIRDGYAKRDVIYKALNRGMHEPKNEYQAERLNLLANLIAQGYLDVKVALTESDNLMGMYHEKMGIIEDSDGNKVAFSGSMNESANALLANYETIDVFTSWSADVERVQNKENSFYSIWNNIEPNITTLIFDDFTDDFVKKYQRTSIDVHTYSHPNENANHSDIESTFFKIPESVEFYDYQKDAIAKWVERSCCGIYDMATGAGKTYTALGSLSTLSRMLDDSLAVIIVAPYQHLVEQWVEDINKFNVKPIIAYSYPGQKWRKQFSDAVLCYNTGAIKNFCIIATNATYASDDFQNILSKFKKNYCFVVDEAHNFGAKRLGSLLPKKARYRLALSATIERRHDEEGTELLKNYFGHTPCIQFTLKDAISRGFLTGYYYYPIITYLNDEELEEYNELTYLINKNGGANPEKGQVSKYVEMLLIKRARIIAGCKEKVERLIEVMEKHRSESHMLVYCGATKYDNSELKDDEEVRQIDEVIRRLYSDLGMKVRRFTSSENKEEREDIRASFAAGEDLQAIVAIKCLDEGVNIPAIKTAFILASSTNPKEYIQRRGRVLRKAKGKEHAIIYDFITLPRKLDRVPYLSPENVRYDLSLIRKEFLRMDDFAETARNPSSIDALKEQIQAAYNQTIVGGYDE